MKYLSVRRNQVIRVALHYVVSSRLVSRSWFLYTSCTGHQAAGAAGGVRRSVPVRLTTGLLHRVSTSLLLLLLSMQATSWRKSKAEGLLQLRVQHWVEQELSSQTLCSKGVQGHDRWDGKGCSNRLLEPGQVLRTARPYTSPCLVGPRTTHHAPRTTHCAEPRWFPLATQVHVKLSERHTYHPFPRFPSCASSDPRSQPDNFRSTCDWIPRID